MSANQELQKEKFLPALGFEPGPFAYEATSLSVSLLGDISTEHINVDRDLPECDIEIYLYRVPRGRCSNMFCRVLQFINSLQQANVLISQTAKRYKYNMAKIRDKSFPRV